MIYFIIGGFLCLWFLLSCFIVTKTEIGLKKTRAKIRAIDEKLYHYKDVDPKFCLAGITTMFDFYERIKSDKYYNSLDEAKQKLIEIAANGYCKAVKKRDIFYKKERKLESLYNYFNYDCSLFVVVKWLFGIIGLLMLTICSCTLIAYAAEIQECKSKIEVYSDMSNNVKPYEEDVLELLYKIQKAKELTKNNYWTSLRTKKWLELNEEPLKNIKETKGFNTVAPRAIIKDNS